MATPIPPNRAAFSIPYIVALTGGTLRGGATEVSAS